MNYYLYKLRFASALHVGSDSGRDNLASSEFTIHSDTLFSALCIEAIHNGGEKCLNQLVGMFDRGEAILSDTLPFCAEEYFLPKPVLKKHAVHMDSEPKDRKLYKNLTYVPLSMFDEYLASASGAPFDIHRAALLLQDIVLYDKRQCVAISRQEETQPYFIGSVVFNDDCGLYMIVGCENDEAKTMLNKLLKSLSYSGIGGKRSIGCGKFVLENSVEIAISDNPSFKTLHSLLNNKNANVYMTLNTSLPTEQELDEVVPTGRFMLCHRGGFVQSMSYSDTPLKKKNLYAFASGACLEMPYKGAVYDIASGGKHPVYCCLKPLFAGVNI